MAKYLAGICCRSVIYWTALCSLADAQVSPVLQDVQNSQPSFLVRAELNRASGSYREDDYLALTVVSEVDSYVYVLYQQSDGQVFQIFPNQMQPANRLQAKQPTRIPSSDELFRWRIEAPFGAERLKILAAREPIEELVSPALRSRFFNSLNSNHLKSIELELADERPQDWAEYEINFRTYAKSTSLETDRSRRFGILFGVSHYEFNAEHEIASGGASLNLPTCHRDANVLAKWMKDVGRLDELRIYNNELATRKQLEEAVTRWLPSVSRPGDTVFIYFSGHGAQIEDDNGDESDGKDELLVPHDAASAATLAVLLNQQKEGTLTPPLQRRLAELARLAQGSDATATNVRELDHKLRRQTCVSDDVFGHWLQRLDGRNVVTLLDVCFAGGFSDVEKGQINENGQPLKFDFLDGELGRLKDIGQSRAILMSSSSANEVSLMRDDRFPRDQGPLSVFTSYLVDSLLMANQAVTVRDGYDHCERGMQQYFQQRPNVKPHRPFLFIGTSADVYLKP